MENTKAKILVCCHQKPDFVWNNEVYMPIQVGRAISNEKLDMVGDDTGDNISSHNKDYCELTGLYWAWKNLKDADYVGLCHYRRYFDFRMHCLRSLDMRSISPEKFSSVPIQMPGFKELFQKYDIVLAKPRICPLSIFAQYSKYHSIIDVQTLKEVIDDIEIGYAEAFNKVIVYNNKLSPYNMFITKREIMNEYCDWVFGILNEIQNRLDPSLLQKRILGYLAELLLPVYVEKNNLKIKHVPILWVNDNVKPSNVISEVNYSCRMVYRNLKFWGTKIP